jgi:hypothetical protein
MTNQINLYIHDALPTALIASDGDAWFVLAGASETIWQARRPIPQPSACSLQPAMLFAGGAFAASADLPSNTRWAKA